MVTYPHKMDIAQKPTTTDRSPASRPRPVATRSTTATDVIDLKRLTVGARQQLLDDLYTVHCQIFCAVDKHSFVTYLEASKAQRTVIHVYKDRSAVVGYFAFHVYENTLNGQTVALLRAESGLLPAYRGYSVNARMALNQVLRYRLAHPRRPLY